MRDGICPKCGSNDVYKRRNGLHDGDRDGRVTLITGPLNSPSPTMAYVCANCGYFELYIDDTIKLAQISEHWERAHGQN
ncbi:MAG: hypothetical protein MUF87_15990 [Anaerolineae bacterium]|nr:hypothetical protein [Anaerolineae bacterium]